MSNVIGIDLGTTNSAVAFLENGEPKIIANAEGIRTTPSIVAFKKGDGEVLVGEIARRQAVTNHDRTFAEVKRHMGTNWTTPDIDGKKYRAEEISARILQKLKKDAETYLGGPVTEAVITVPAYFNDQQRSATQKAGEIAGLKVLRIINEPTSAALAYGVDKGKENELVLIYDLGGGTYDVSLLEVDKSDGQSTVQVVATNGDNHLGGSDWDTTLTKYIVDEFRKESGVDLSSDNMAMARIREAAEQAKKDLSNAFETTVNLPYISMGSAGPLNLSVVVTRSKFEEITKSLLARTEAPIRDVLKEANVSASDVHTVILVGGSTRMPAVEVLVEKIMGQKASHTVNPDEVVALGAAVQGAVLKGVRTDVLLLDVTPLNLGIEVKGGLMQTLISRNTAIPTRASEVFTTAENNQSSVTVRVFQGQREFTRDNLLLGQFDLSVAPAPAGMPQIEVSFDIDANGLVNVTAKDKGTGKASSVTVSGSSELSDADVERMVADAEAQHAADAARREVVELRNAGEGLVSQARKSVAEAGDSIPVDVRENVEEAVRSLEAEVKSEGASKESLTTAIQEVNDRLMKVGEAVYGAQNTSASAPAGEPSAPSEDEVVDAEIVEE